MGDPRAEARWMFSQQFWDERYEGGPVFSGEPNPWLVRHASTLAPGAALDFGSGEGADAIWLAARGWSVTGLDISPVALARAARLAGRSGAPVAARITWQHADALSVELPENHYDLVSAQYMHLPGDALRKLHHRLAAAVRPGGTLLLVLHDAPAPGTGHSDVPADVFTSAEGMASVLDPSEWVIDAGRHERPATGAPHPAGHTHDVVLHAVRHPDRPAPERSAPPASRPRGSYWSMADARWVSPA